MASKNAVYGNSTMAAVHTISRDYIMVKRIM